MGVADRDYWKGEVKRTRGGAGSRLTPVVSWLLMLNVAVFFGDMLVFDHWLVRLGVFTVGSGLFEARLWELVTFQFLHAGIGHLLMNMLGLYFFGPWLEQWWGSRRFTAYYLLCGVAGALFYSLLWWLGMFPGVGVNTPLLGASAGVYGVLIGVAVTAPSLRVMLVFPPVELSMRQLALGVMAIAVISVITGWGGNAGGDAGHLGGALLGYLLMRRPALLAWAAAKDADVEIIPPRAFRPPGGPGPTVETNPRLAAEVDRILEKISEHGMHSITQAERKTLDRLAKTRQPPP